nr:tape measure protein [Brevibacterium sp. 68QC2CO]
MEGVKKTAEVTGGAVVGVLGTALGKGFNRLSNIDAAQAKLKGLGNDAKSVDTIMANANEAVSGTAFSLDAAATTAAGAVAAGIKPGKELTGVLKTVANSAAASGSDMGEMGIIFNKVAASGKAQTDSLNMLADRGLPIFTALQQVTGKTGDELNKFVSGGKVDFAMYAKAAKLASGTVADEMGNTLTGTFQNLNAALGRMGATMLEGIFPTVAVLGQGAQKLISALAKSLAPASEAIGKALQPVADKLGKIFASLADDGVMDGLVKTIQDMAPVLAPLLGGLAAMSSGLLSKIPLLGSLFPAINPLVGVLAGLVAISPELRSALMGVVTMLGDTLLPLFKDAGPALGGGLKDILMQVAGVLAQVVKMATPLIQSLLQTIVPLIGTVIGVVMTLVKALMPAISSVIGALSPVVQAIGAVIGAVMPIVSVLVKVLAAILIPVVKVLAAVFSAVFGVVARVVTVALNIVAGVLGGIIPFFTQVIPAAVRWFAGVFSGVWAGIMTAVQAVVGWFQTSVVPVFQAVWTGIATTLQWLWNFVIKPIWTVIQFAFLALATAIGLYWKIVLKPVFTAISLVAQWLWNTVLKPVFGWIQNGWNFLVNGIKLLWESVLRPAFSAVGAFAGWLWNSAIKPALNGIKAGWTLMVNGIKAAWTNLLKPALSAVGTAVKFLKDSVWTPTVNGIKSAWSVMAGGIRNVKTSIIDPVFEGIKKAVHAVKTAFEKAKDGIGTAWGKLKEITRKPVEFIVNTVYTNGIQKVWNGIANAVGMKDKTLPDVKFADGGVMPGYTPGRDVHHFYSPTAGGLHLSGGEAIMRPEFTRAVGGPVGIAQMNTAAKQGGSRGLANYLKFGGESSSAFADGGVWAAAGKNGGALPSAVSRAQAWARSQVGKPYIWGGTGPAGYDCSGFMSAITNVLTGRSPYNRLFATGSFGRNRGVAGFQPGLQGSAFSIGVSPNTGSGIGHTAGTLGGMNVESYGHHGPATGGGARGADDSLFPWKFHLPTVGGQFVSGGGRTGGGGGGSLINLSPLTNLIKKLAKIPKAGGWSDMISGAVKGMINKLVSVATPFGGGGAIAETASKWVSAGKAMAVRAKGIAWALQQGWGPAEVKDMDWIIQRESGWNNKSTGGTSSATGLPQFLTMQCDEQGFAAPLSQYSMEFQLQAMKRYVDGRFGNFAKAKAFWQSHHWYDQGGVIPTSLGVYDNGGFMPPGGAGLNLSSSSEYVLTGPQSDLLTAGLRQMQAAPAGGGGMVTVEVTVTGDVYGVDDLEERLQDGIEEGMERVLREWEERR